MNEENKELLKLCNLIVCFVNAKVNYIIGFVTHRIPVIALKRLIDRVAYEICVFGGKSAVDISYGISSSKLLYLVLHFKHFICPAIVGLVLVIIYLTGIFIVIGGDDTFHKSCYTFGIACSLAEIVAVDLGIVVILVCIFILWNGNEENVFGRAEIFCPDIGSLLYLIKSADVEKLLALTHKLYLRLPVKQILVKHKTVFVQFILKLHCSLKGGVVQIVDKLSVGN